MLKRICSNVSRVLFSDGIYSLCKMLWDRLKNIFLIAQDNGSKRLLEVDKQMVNDIGARKLIHTVQGQKWLSQFDRLDQEIASLIANNLTLISHNEFERNLVLKIADVVDGIVGPVAFFAMREMVEQKEVLKGKSIPQLVRVAVPFYEQVEICDDGVSISPLSKTADVGSEGRIAAIIRQFCKRDKKMFLNHPTLEHLKTTKCNAIICIDDFIGSGGRAHEFLDTLWQEKTIVSWHSSKHIKFHVIAYSATEKGIERTKEHKSAPLVHIYRDAPTFYDLPWSKERKEAVFDLCKKYGKKANNKRRHMWWGYNKSMSSIVFEHGCPNNAPVILVEENNKWVGLFPNKTIADTTLSVFPNVISQKTNPESLEGVGQKKLAKSVKLMRRGDKGQIILTLLALIAKGKHKRATLCFATGLSNDACDAYLSKCIKWGYVSPQKRITPLGLAELKAAKRIGKVKSEKLEKGSDYYYPQQLRKAT